ncbi:MAG: transposase [Planctomycetes bacterium]|nr:transposase [Planctomycetota bacterium]
MAFNYTTCDRDTLFLLPPSLQEWLPQDHLAWFLLEAIEHMDLSPFHAAHRDDGKGQRAHHPQIMLAVLLYGYCHGERSSRQLERLCQESVPYRVLAANTAPDHCAFARFRQRHEAAMKALFVEVLRLCAAAGLVRAGKVSLDGTKMKANASLADNRTEAALIKEVEQMLAEAATQDTAEDGEHGPGHRGDELPVPLRARADRLQRLQAAKERLASERRAAEVEQQRKLAARQRSEQESGQRLPGRKPKRVEDVRAEHEQRKANTTAPESRILKTRSGHIQGFNAQAVCTDQQIILAAQVTNQENDQGLYHPMMAAAQAQALAVLGEVEGKIGLGRADAGYCNEEDLARACDYDMLVATSNDRKRRQELQEAPPPRGRIPADLTATQRMERRLRTQAGREEYKKRSQTIEPVFGQIKDSRGLDSFYGRALATADSEWHLICATHNLLKLFGWMRNLQN